MSTHRWMDRICVVVIVLSLIVTILFMNGEKLGIQRIADTDAEGYAGSEYFTENDLNGSWDSSEAVKITLCGDSAKISGNGAYWLDGSLVIAQSGQYVISGELTDGNIVVDAARNSKVWIMLSGVTLHCSDDACIRIDQADKVFLTLADGSENSLTGGDAFTENAPADGTDAVIFSHDDLTINGNGSLSIVSSALNGITSKDDLIITGGTVSVTVSGHGLRVNDHFRMTSANLTVSAGQDGIHAEGAVVIQDGNLTITAGDDAVHSDASVLILGGIILVNDCYEGIEALTIEISGGDTTIHSRDDGLNANGYTGVEWGGMPSPGKDPPDTEAAAPAESSASPEASSEEASPPAFPGGGRSGEPPAFPDADRSGEPPAFPDADRTGEPPAREEMGSPPPFGEGSGPEQENRSDPTEEKTVVSVEDTWILISGGRLTLLNESGTDADGIDSNGNITITGGTVLVSLVGSSGNSALDCGSESGGIAAISGGTVIACGDSSMAEGFGSESAQASILYSLREAAAAGSTVTLLDAEGKEMISETIPYGFSSVVISCPDLAVGQTCTLRIGETEETIEITSVSVTAGEASRAGTAPGGFMPGSP